MRRDALLTASVLAWPNMSPMPAPARTTNQTWDERLRSVIFEAHRANPTAASTEPRKTGRLAPRRSSMRPPIWAATTKPAKKYRRTKLALRVGSPRLIWTYSLAKKNTGMNARLAIPRMRFSTENALEEKILTSMSGESVRRS